jgi:hypothetical protein
VKQKATASTTAYAVFSISGPPLWQMLMDPFPTFYSSSRGGASEFGPVAADRNSSDRPSSWDAPEPGEIEEDGVMSV